MIERANKTGPLPKKINHSVKSPRAKKKKAIERKKKIFVSSFLFLVSKKIPTIKVTIAVGMCAYNNNDTGV
ncbi:MAG: hypothetical protein NTZ87_00600 [Candidatus Nomurabacteria bacterium]|nr:hypothetical protein [Candidatus Nomurabacteria bacterium]